MISQLTIKNFGLFENISINFNKNLNIFTGETGAGKSIIIDAVNYALGQKLNTNQIRNKNIPCFVEVIFELSKTQIQEIPILEDYITENNIFIITRTFLQNGQNKNKINDFTITLTQLKKIGTCLVDFHGPHDHQMLFFENSHIEILDRLSNIKNEKNIYLENFNKLKQKQTQLLDLENNYKTKENQLYTLENQIQELQQVSLEQEEYNNIIQKTQQINNIESFFNNTQELINIIENEEYSINKLIEKAFIPLSQLNNIDKETTQFTNLLEEIQEKSSDLSYMLNNFLESLSFHPNEAKEINKKYDIYYSLIKKYGPTIEKVKEHYTQIKNQYNKLLNIETNTTQIKKSIQNTKNKLKKIANNITKQRKITAKKLETTIKNELKELGFLHIEFEIKIENTELTKNGQNKITFYISPNKGEKLKPLSDIVSSGEAARVMLALKKALTKVDPIPVLIFDEIDAQIGGRLGNITGKKLKEISNNRQIILITHLPQIASFANHHYKISKEINNNRTITKIELLNEKTKILELAKMMTGEKTTKIALQHAQDMLNNAEKIT